LKNGIKTLAMWLIIGVIFLVLLTTIVENSDSKLKYSELVSEINASNVEAIQVEANGKTATVTLKDDKIKKEVNIPNIESFMAYTEDYLKEGAFTLEEKSESIFVTVISLLTPFGLLIIFFIFWFFMMGGVAGNGAPGGKNVAFGKSKARMMTPAEKNRITFEDVAGVDEEKEEATFQKGGAIDALTELKAQGKIRFVGVASHYYSILWRGARDKRVDVLQGSGNILERGMLDRIEKEDCFLQK